MYLTFNGMAYVEYRIKMFKKNKDNDINETIRWFYFCAYNLTASLKEKFFNSVKLKNNQESANQIAKITIPLHLSEQHRQMSLTS